MGSTSSLKQRIERLADSLGQGSARFMGMLDFKYGIETPDDAAKRAPGPGLYLVTDDHLNHGHVCIVASDGTYTIHSAPIGPTAA